MDWMRLDELEFKLPFRLAHSVSCQFKYVPKIQL